MRHHSRTRKPRPTLTFLPRIAPLRTGLQYARKVCLEQLTFAGRHRKYSASGIGKSVWILIGFRGRQTQQRSAWITWF